MIIQTFRGLKEDLGVRIRLEEERSGCGTRCYTVNSMRMQISLVLLDAQKTIQVAHGPFRAVFE